MAAQSKGMIKIDKLAATGMEGKVICKVHPLYVLVQQGSSSLDRGGSIYLLGALLVVLVKVWWWVGDEVSVTTASLLVSPTLCLLTLPNSPISVTRDTSHEHYATDTGTGPATQQTRPVSVTADTASR